MKERFWFDPDGTRHPVKGGTTPIGVPNDRQTFKPQKIKAYIKDKSIKNYYNF